jgi:uracil-DNA glycosylase
VIIDGIIAVLASARIGNTFNQYRGSQLRCERLRDYLPAREAAPILLVGEAAGYRGARVSGIPFTSERQLTGTGPAEATATIVHRVLAELDLEADVLLWNVVPTHPGTDTSNRRPTRTEIEAGRPFLDVLLRGRRTIAVGRVAEAVLGGAYLRHPAHGGAEEFRAGLARLTAAERQSARSFGPASAEARPVDVALPPTTRSKLATSRRESLPVPAPRSSTVAGAGKPAISTTPGGQPGRPRS